MCYRTLARLTFAALLFSAASVSSAAPVTVGLDLVGPGPNTLDLDATGSGVVTTGITAKILGFANFTGTPDPQTDAIGLNPDTISVMSTPIALATNMTSGPATAMLEIERTTWTPLSISDLNIDMLNGVTPAFALDTLVLETNQTIIPGVIDDGSVRIDVSGTFQSVKFFQAAGPASFGPGNTYAIPGTLLGVVDLTVNLDLFDGVLFLNTGLGTQEFDAPFTLEGTLGVNTTSPNHANLSFDGLTIGDFDLGDISTTLSADLAGQIFNLSLDVNGGINLNFAYHLEDTAQVPEPGAIILFALGALGIVPFARRKLLRK